VLEKQQYYNLLWAFDTDYIINEKFITLLYYFLGKIPIYRDESIHKVGFKTIKKKINKRLIRRPEIAQIPGFNKLLELLRDR
jgi:hypothetical protein